MFYDGYRALLGFVVVSEPKRFESSAIEHLKGLDDAQKFPKGYLYDSFEFKRTVSKGRLLSKRYVAIGRILVAGPLSKTKAEAKKNGELAIKSIENEFPFILENSGVVIDVRISQLFDARKFVPATEYKQYDATGDSEEFMFLQSFVYDYDGWFGSGEVSYFMKEIRGDYFGNSYDRTYESFEGSGNGNWDDGIGSSSYTDNNVSGITDIGSSESSSESQGTFSSDSFESSSASGSYDSSSSDSGSSGGGDSGGGGD